MKKIFLLLILLLALTQQANATDVTYTDKSTGDSFTAADANEIKTAVNSKQDETTADILADGTVPMAADWPFGAFDITGGVDSTWSGVGTFGTLSAGAAGFTVDADGDTVVKSITSDAEVAFNMGGSINNLIFSGTTDYFLDDTETDTDHVLSASKIKSKYLSGTEADFHGTFIDPDAVYQVTPSITISNLVPAAFTITKISISCDADPTTEITMTFNHKAAGVGYGTPTAIVTSGISTTAGVATHTTPWNDATIPAGVKLFVTLSDPDDALLECAWQIEGDWD